MVEIVDAGKQNVETGVKHTYTVEDGLNNISTIVNTMAVKIDESNQEINVYLAQVRTAATLQQQSLKEIKEVGKLFKKTAQTLEESSNKIKLRSENSEMQQELEPLVNRVKKLLIEKASTKEILSLEAAVHRAALTRILQENSGLEAIWSNRADGSFIFSEPPAGLADAKIRPWWKQAMAGKNYVSEIYVSAITQKLCITLSVPIRTMTVLYREFWALIFAWSSEKKVKKTESPS